MHFVTINRTQHFFLIRSRIKWRDIRYKRQPAIITYAGIYEIHQKSVASTKTNKA